eukprot:54588-Eustigmatos_ZCMA.PRE.1
MEALPHFPGLLHCEVVVIRALHVKHVQVRVNMYVLAVIARVDPCGPFQGLLCQQRLAISCLADPISAKE